MELIYVNHLGRINENDLGPAWVECSEATEKVFKKAAIQWGNMGFMEECEPIECQLKYTKEKNRRTGTEFVRCEGYSLWFINDWPYAVKFVKKPEGIYGCYCDGRNLWVLLRGE